MYTLDINFLSDRVAAETQSAVERQPIADSQFLLYGAIAAAVALAPVGGAYLYLSSEKAAVQTKLDALTSQESQLDAQIKALDVQVAQFTAIEARKNELLSLFVGNLPASAIATDISNRTPISVQIKSITQASAAADPQDPSRVVSEINLNGSATNYGELNDYLLLLQASPFLDPTETKIVSSTLQQATVDKNFNLVNFQNKSVLTSKRPDELLPDLQKTGADGLVTRVNLLRQQGVIK